MDAGGAQTATLDATRAVGTGDAYLLVVEQESSRMFPLPDPCVVTIGRTTEAELALNHASVSRRHARIFVDAGVVRISDLDSHNGTRVNGELLGDGRVLTTGDVVAIGEVILVVHAQPVRVTAPVLIDERAWRARLTAEVERAVSFQRPLSVLAIVGETDVALRTIDVLARADDHTLLALLPEADAATARALADRLLRGSAVRIGLATCPNDATDPDSLIHAARAAAKIAPERAVANLTDAVERRTFADREVLICDPAMIRVYDLLKRLATSTLPVLIFGETGVGKENAAYAVHHHSARNGRPFVALNCAALTESIVESELFGHERGAFTGATHTRPGVLEAASTGTLFLDEIGELSLSVQAKLLRALETQRITRVGSSDERPIDVRFVAATNRVLEKEVEAGRFRQDLFFRLGAAHVHIPPLRDRRCEIPVLFRELVAKAAVRAGREPPVATPAAMQRLLDHTWPGNVRELKHVAELVVAIVEDDRIEPDDLPGALAPATPPAAVPTAMRKLADELEALERLRMAEALATTGGIKTRAAALLGMPIRTFAMKVRQYGL